MSSTVSRARVQWRLLCLAATLLALSGCATTARFQEKDIAAGTLSDYLKDKPEPIQAHYATLLRQGQRNSVLNHMRAGLGAIELGAFTVAKSSFDEALAGIE